MSRSRRTRKRRDLLRPTRRSVSVKSHSLARSFHCEQLEDRLLLANDVAKIQFVHTGFEPIVEPFGANSVQLSSILARAASQPFVTGELLVAYQRGLNEPDWGIRLGDPTVMVEKTILSHNVGEVTVDIVHLDIGNTRVVTAIRQLAGQADVLWSAPNFTYDEPGAAELTPDDPEFVNQYHHVLMQNELAWDFTLGEASIVIGITDDGIDLNHPDLAENIYVNSGEIADNGIDDDGNGYIDDVHGWDFVDQDADVSPSSNHGTHVAGIAAAQTDNAIGVSGIAGDASIMPLKFYDRTQGNLWTSAIVAETFAYAADSGVQIVNTSYNIDFFAGDPVFAAGLQYSYDLGVLHFNSAGNSNRLNPPRQEFTQTLLVANTSAADTKFVNSNFGTGIDISAPGADILSTNVGGGYYISTGTSMAAPNAAGAAALIWSHNLTWTRDMVAAQLLATADNIDAQDPIYAGLLGSGRVNTHSALSQTVADPQVESLFGLPADGAVIDTLTIDSVQVAFNQVMDPASVNNLLNYDLRSAGVDGVFDTEDDGIIAISLPKQYQIGTNDLTIDFAKALGPGEYRMRLAAGLQNPFGSAMDGDADGTGGDDFATHFTVTTPALTLLEPAGGLLYTTEFSQEINSATEGDTFPISLEAGLNLSVKVTGTGDFVPLIQITDSAGGELANVSSGGNEVIVQSVAASSGGDVLINVFGDAETTGDYRVTVVLDGMLEEEGTAIGFNDTALTAVDITSSTVDLGSLGAERMAILGQQVAEDEDWYSLTLEDQDSVSVALHSLAVGSVELYDSQGIHLATGTSNFMAANAIDEFLDTTSDGLGEVYFVRVVGASLEYALVVTRNAGLDDEIAGHVGSGSQRLIGTGVLGHVDDAPSYVAVPDTMLPGEVLDSAFDEVTLSNTIGGSVFATPSASGSLVFGPAATPGDFVPAGGWSEGDNELRADFTQPVHFVSIEIVANDGADRALLRAFDANDVLLKEVVSNAQATGEGQALTISRQDADIAYVIAAGVGHDMVSFDRLKFGAAGGQDAYQITLDSTDTLSVAAFTPGDGPFGFDNGLTPAEIQLELLDPMGVSVATGNASLSHSIADPGDYQLIVSVTDGSGEYFLEVTGGTPLPTAAVHVTATALPNGVHLTNFPTSVIMDFDAALAMASVDPSDVLIGGLPATSVSVIDGDTLEFSIDPAANAGVGSYQVKLAADGVQDFLGNGNAAFSSSFFYEDVQPFVPNGLEGSLISTSYGNMGALGQGGGVASFTFLVQEDETIAAIVQPRTMGATLQVTVAGSGTTYTAPEVELPVVLPASSVATAGPVTIEVSAEIAANFEVTIIRNATIHDSTLAATDLAASLMLVGQGARYAGIGSLESYIETEDFEPNGFDRNGVSPGIASRGPQVSIETDAFTLDLTNKVGVMLDVAVTGTVDFTTATLELVAPDGMVVATGDLLLDDQLAIQQHAIAQSGVYVIRLTGNTTGDYQLLVGEDLVLDMPSLAGAEGRDLDSTRTAVGFVGDDPDTFTIDLALGETLTIQTGLPLSDVYHAPANALDPLVILRDATGMIVATDSGSLDGQNVELVWTATAEGAYKILLGSEAAAGFYALSTTVDVVLPRGDFDGNGSFDCHDIDALVADISSAAHSSAFDLTGDGKVDLGDRNALLAHAAAAKGFAAPLLLGDANLDGSVDVSDFAAWSSNKFTFNAGWCGGDFDADGDVDASDFNIWNAHKFVSIPTSLATTSLGLDVAPADTTTSQSVVAERSSRQPADIRPLFRVTTAREFNPQIQKATDRVFADSASRRDSLIKRVFLERGDKSAEATTPREVALRAWPWRN